MAAELFYLHDVKQAASGQDVNINVYMTDENGAHITSDSFIELWNGVLMLYKGKGEYNGTYWTFTIPADVTMVLHGRYYYAICNEEHDINDITTLYII